MTNEVINILCATDNRYAPYCGIMLTSLLENNKHNMIDIYILGGNDISQENVEKFKHLESIYNAHVDVITIDDNLLSTCPVNKDTNITLATYYRLLAPQILPDSVHKLIYLDCDMIVAGDISPIWDTNLDGKAIAGVVDCEAYNESIYQRLGDYTLKRDYYNAGMTVYNMDYWIENNIAEEAFKYIEQNSKKLYWMDQDVLNVVMKDLKRNLPVTYNYQIQLQMPYFFNTFSKRMQEDVRNTTSPKIIHYAAELKPWMAYYYSYPFYHTWQKYKKLSPWKYMADQLPKTRKFVAWVKRYLIWPFGIWLKKPELIEP